MEQQMVANGGLQYVPLAAGDQLNGGIDPAGEQLVFSGELISAGETLAVMGQSDSSDAVLSGEADTIMMGVNILPGTEAAEESPVISLAEDPINGAVSSSTFTVAGLGEAFVAGYEGLEWGDFSAYSSSYGGYYYNSDDIIDAEKCAQITVDDMMCWAAATANILYYTNWLVEGVTDEDDIFSIFVDNFLKGENDGGNAYYGIDWYLTGQYAFAESPGWDTPLKNTGGYYTEAMQGKKKNDYYYSKNTITVDSLQEAITKLKAGYGIQLSFGYYDKNGNRGGGHAVTLWGLTYDTTVSVDSPEYYTGVILSDSDDNQGNTQDPGQITDKLKIISITWDKAALKGKGAYVLDPNYAGERTWIDGLVFLAPKPVEMTSKAPTSTEEGNVRIYKEGKLITSTSDPANNLVLNTENGAYMKVLQGGVVNSTGIMTSGRLYVSNGGRANNTTVEAGGNLYLSNGGQANETEVKTGGYFHISSGGLADGTILTAGNQFIYDGGAAANTSVGGGTLYIFSGGVHKGSLHLENNAKVSAYSGGIVDFTLAGRGTTADYLINNLALISGTPTFTITVDDIQAAGTYKLAQGANSFSGTITVKNTSGSIGEVSTVNALTHNQKQYTLIQDSGNLSFQVSDLLEGLVKIYNGEELVSSGNILENQTLETSYNMHISSGGIATNTTAKENAVIHISSGGIASNTTMNTGGIMYISSGGFHKGALQIDAGAVVSAYEEGTIDFSLAERTEADTYLINNLALISGTPTFTVTVADNQSFGTYKLAQGADSFSGTITITTQAGVESGALAPGENCNFNGKNYALQKEAGDLTILIGNERQDKIKIYSGADVISSANVMYNQILAEDHAMYISSGGVATNTTVESAASMYVSSGGSAFNAAVNSDGQLHISSGGRFLGTMTLANGAVVSAYDGSEIAYTLFERTTDQGYMITDLALISGTPTYTVYVAEPQAAGTYKLAQNAESFNDTITVSTISGKEIGIVGIGDQVKSAGRSYLLEKTEGNLHLTVSTYATNMVQVFLGSKFITSGDILDDITLENSYIMNITSGGTATQTKVNSGGYVRISSGGMANDTQINSWGFQFVSNGGVVSNTQINTGGNMRVSSGGLALDTKLGSKGNLTVYSGGVASDTNISGGFLYVSGGGTVQDTQIQSAGRMTLYEGAVHKGSLKISSDAVVTVLNATIDFTLTGRTQQSDYLVNDLSQFHGTPVYTVTVAADQASGTYKLAQKASGFAGTITIGDGSVPYGTLSVNGEDLVYNGRTYSLDQVNGNLSLTITGPILLGGANGVSWNELSGSGFTVEYTRNDFTNVLQVRTDSNAVDTYNMPEGTYQWQVSGNNKTEYRNNGFKTNTDQTPSQIISDTDGNLDLFFAKASGTWENLYGAEHQGISGSWAGTQETVKLAGKNKIEDVISGSTDANILLLTDDANGDALFVDDIFSALGGQARLSNIDEIRAGNGDDLIDMTSNQFAYTGNGIKIYGGLGNDTIWANNGSNILFGDAGDDRIVGASGNDVIVGGTGNDSLHGGGGSDTFTFGGSWGNDTVEQLSGGDVTLWFAEGSEANWDAETLTYTDGANSVRVSGISAENITLKFGGDLSSLPEGAFAEAASEKIFEDKNKGFLA